MKFIIVDDEPLAFGDLKNKLCQAVENAEIETFASSTAALKYVREKNIDVALLDIEMPLMNGLELAKNIKEIQPKANIIFVTAYSKYAVDAHKMYVSGYLLKPTSKEDILLALENLRNPINKRSRIEIKTFGGFEIIVDGKLLKFTRSKTKELLAYLVDRKGFSQNMTQVSSALWENANTSSDKSNLRNLIVDLTSTLKAVNASDIVIKDYNSIRIDPLKLECDYYDFIYGKAYAVNSYHGEYMTGYAWAKFSFTKTYLK